MSAVPSLDVPSDGVDVEAELRTYSAETQRAIARVLRSDVSNPWLDDLVADYPARGGKGLRPAMMLATCQAYGGAMDDALRRAAGIEMLHNAFLIRDDIEDGSELRRGRATLHREFGMALALNASDALALSAATLLQSEDHLGARIGRRLGDEFRHMMRQSIDGQATELGWRRDNVVDLVPDDYLDMIGRKTCWYTTVYPIRVGALIGSRGVVSLSGLNRFGFYLGAAFQIRDDLLNLVGRVEVYGKELCGDLREGKRTLMLIHLLQHATPAEHRFLVEYLADDDRSRSDRDVRRVLDLMYEHGSIDFAIEFGQGIAAAAYDAFDEAYSDAIDTRHRQFMRALISYMLHRDV